MLVVLLDGREGGDDGCWIKKARDGTVARFPGSASVTNRYSGRVRCPASRAEIVTRDGHLVVFCVAECPRMWDKSIGEI